MQPTPPPINKQIMQTAHRVFYNPSIGPCHASFDKLKDLLGEGWKVKMVSENKSQWADYILEKERN